jgi:16S rRNA (guanine527-N7)-methyltransferase
VDAFSRYLRLLLRWNRAHSLTAYRDPGAILQKLFLDSLLFLRFLPAHIQRVLDLGSGAGIPGIPLKIVQPQYSLTLIEARRRRTSFLAAVVRELGLEDVRVLTGRAEALIKQFPWLGGEFDAVLTRAAGPLDMIAPLALRFLKPGGRFLASGPPLGKFAGLPVSPASWHIVTSPTSGSKRRLLMLEKTA